MGLKPDEVRRLTYRDFTLMLHGYEARQEKEWNQTRHVMAYVLNYAGMGAGQYYPPQSVLPLRMDEEDKIKPIINMRMAAKLYQEFLN